MVGPGMFQGVHLIKPVIVIEVESGLEFANKMEIMREEIRSTVYEHYLDICS